MSADQEEILASQTGPKQTKEKKTKLLDLFKMCLDKKEMESKIREQNFRNLLTVRVLRETPEYKHIEKIGLEKFVDEIIRRGVSLSTTGRVYVGAALTSSEIMREELRTKVGSLSIYIE